VEAHLKHGVTRRSPSLPAWSTWSKREGLEDFPLFVHSNAYPVPGTNNKWHSAPSNAICC
jgi:hypothetical protein